MSWDESNGVLPEEKVRGVSPGGGLGPRTVLPFLPFRIGMQVRPPYPPPPPRPGSVRATVFNVFQPGSGASQGSTDTAIQKAITESASSPDDLLRGATFRGVCISAYLP